MRLTPNLKLKQWQGTDLVSAVFAAFNDNADIIDSKVSTNTANIGLLDTGGRISYAQYVTIDSTDRAWHTTDSGIFTTTSTGTSRGYPVNHATIIHTRAYGGSLVIQILFGDGIVATRRFSTTQSMDWKQVALS